VAPTHLNFIQLVNIGGNHFRNDNDYISGGRSSRTSAVAASSHPRGFDLVAGVTSQSIASHSLWQYRIRFHRHPYSYSCWYSYSYSCFPESLLLRSSSWKWFR
jgi:hypothetical protein